MFFANLLGLHWRPSAQLDADGAHFRSVEPSISSTSVSMDGFTGFKTATNEELPDAVAVMDPFHVVRLGGEALDQCRRRVQQDACGHRGRTGDPLFRCRRTLLTGADLLTDTQHDRLDDLFAADDRVEVEATRGVYQQMIAAFANRTERRAASR